MRELRRLPAFCQDSGAQIIVNTSTRMLHRPATLDRNYLALCAFSQHGQEEEERAGRRSFGPQRRQHAPVVQRQCEKAAAATRTFDIGTDHLSQ